MTTPGGRKRKIDALIPEADFFSDEPVRGAETEQPAPTHSTSANNIHTSGSRDLYYRPRTKNGRRKNSNTSLDTLVICSHGTCPEIGDKVLNYRGERVAENIPGRPLNPVKLRLSCEMGDVWEHKYSEIKCNQVVKTGEKFTDRVLDKLQNHGYSVQSCLSKGRYANVILVYSYERRKHLAVKFVLGDLKRAMSNPAESKENYLTTLPDEVTMYETLHHPNVVELYGYQLLNGRLLLTLEFCPNGSLTSLLQMHPGRILAECPARGYFKDLMEGLDYVHKSNVVHLDIRTQNLLLDQYDRLKIADFDSARRFCNGDPLFSEKVGHKGYTTPEVLLEKQYNPRKVDIWSTGVVLFKMIAGRLPFKSDRGKEVMLDMINKTVMIHFRCPDYVSATFSKPLQTLLLALLKKEPAQRPTISQIKRYDWFNEKNKKVYIGNSYMVQQPHKLTHGEEERRIKKEMGI